jgi:hypothetical protein
MTTVAFLLADFTYGSIDFIPGHADSDSIERPYRRWGRNERNANERQREDA